MGLLCFISGVLFGVAASRITLRLWGRAAAVNQRRGRNARAGALAASFALAAGILFVAIGSRHSPKRPAVRDAAAAGAAVVTGKSAPVTANSMDGEVAGSR